MLETVTIPKGKGLIGFEGLAEYQEGFYIGGGNQLYIPNVPKEWSKLISWP
jgi:hypothetical protein